MIIAAPSNRLRLVIALILAIVVAWVPAVNAVAHGLPEIAAAQSDGVPEPDDGHGHSHDDDIAPLGPLGHFHGHDATDHSHDPGNFAFHSPHQTAPLIGRSSWPHDAAAENGLPDRLERPPRALA
jgi:hypothetical protein